MEIDFPRGRMKEMFGNSSLWSRSAGQNVPEQTIAASDLALI